MTTLGFVEDYVKTAGSSRQTIQTLEVSCQPDQFCLVYLREGANTGLNVDGSGPSKLYKYTVPANKMVLITKVIFSIVDATIDPLDFGGISALTNGLLFKVHDSDDVVLLDFLDGRPIKTNADFDDLVGTDVEIHFGAGAAEDLLTVQLDLDEFGALMSLTVGQYIQVTVQDNIAALTEFHVTLHGLIIHAE